MLALILKGKRILEQKPLVMKSRVMKECLQWNVRMLPSNQSLAMRFPQACVIIQAPQIGAGWRAGYLAFIATTSCTVSLQAKRLWGIAVFH